MPQISNIQISVIESDDGALTVHSPIPEGKVLSIPDKTDTVQSVKNILRENNVHPTKLQYVKNSMRRSENRGNFLVLLYSDIHEASIARDVLSDPE